MHSTQNHSKMRSISLLMTPKTARTTRLKSLSPTIANLSEDGLKCKRKREGNEYSFSSETKSSAKGSGPPNQNNSNEEMVINQCLVIAEIKETVERIEEKVDRDMAERKDKRHKSSL